MADVKEHGRVAGASISGSARRLVLVSGHPASGKTTLATCLGAATGWPLVAKDGLKELLFDQLGVGDRDWSRRLGQTSWALMEHVLAIVMAGGASVIAEGNFGPPARAMVQGLITRYRYRAGEIWCDAPPDLLMARFSARAGGGRHPGHGDAESLDEQRARVQRPYEPMNLAPVLRVDTTVSPEHAAALALDWLADALAR